MSSFNPHSSRRWVFYYLHFVIEEAEALGREATGLRLKAPQLWSQGLNPDICGFGVRGMGLERAKWCLLPETAYCFVNLFCVTHCSVLCRDLGHPLVLLLRNVSVRFCDLVVTACWDLPAGGLTEGSGDGLAFGYSFRERFTFMSSNQSFLSIYLFISLC